MINAVNYGSEVDAELAVLLSLCPPSRDVVVAHIDVAQFGGGVSFFESGHCL